MANVTVDKQVVETIKGVKLTLDKDEAQFLADLMTRVLGSGRKEKYGDAIRRALRDSGGFDGKKAPITDFDDRNAMAGYIHFKRQ